MKLGEIIDRVMPLIENMLKFFIPFAILIMFLDMILDISGKSTIDFAYLLPVNFLILVFIFHKITRK
jgi:hypothetical protein